jgi:hypothetical protein
MNSHATEETDLRIYEVFLKLWEWNVQYQKSERMVRRLRNILPRDKWKKTTGVEGHMQQLVLLRYTRRDEYLLAERAPRKSEKRLCLRVAATPTSNPWF